MPIPESRIERAAKSSPRYPRSSRIRLIRRVLLTLYGPVLFAILAGLISNLVQALAVSPQLLSNPGLALHNTFNPLISRYQAFYLDQPILTSAVALVFLALVGSAVWAARDVQQEREALRAREAVASDIGMLRRALASESNADVNYREQSARAARQSLEDAAIAVRSIASDISASNLASGVTGASPPSQPAPTPTHIDEGDHAAESPAPPPLGEADVRRIAANELQQLTGQQIAPLQDQLVQVLSALAETAQRLADVESAVSHQAQPLPIDLTPLIERVATLEVQFRRRSTIATVRDWILFIGGGLVPIGTAIAAIIATLANTAHH